MPDNQYALVVDNNPVIRKIVSSILEDSGWKVRAAENGLEALDIIEEGKPAIIFTDLIMPKIDGEKLLLVVRNTPKLKDIFLVVLSGIAMEDEENKRLGADFYIVKGPASEMRRHIIGALGNHASGIRHSHGIEGFGGRYPSEVAQELLISKKHSEIVFANMTEGVVELNHEGRIVMANKAAVTLLGEDEAQVLGKRLQGMLEGSEQRRVDEWIGDLEPVELLVPLVFEYDNPVQLGDRLITMNLVPVQEGNGLFIIGMLKDVSRRKLLELRQKQLEKELQRIKKIDAMSLMASGIAHDFNNLLTIISGNLEMSRYLTKEQQIADLLKEAGKALGLTLKLIHKFTTFSDNYLPQKEKVHFRKLLSRTLELELADTDVVCEITDQSGTSHITLDSSLVRQVLSNLTSNAVDAMQGKGRIRISVDLVDGEKEAVAKRQPIPNGEMVRVVFEDDGPGIAPDIIDQVFDPYFSTKQKGAQKGMGLGLTIVHSIIKKHGGLVWVQSEPGSGCKVYLYFPVAFSLITDPQYAPDADVGKRRVLVLDDDEMMRALNRKMFEHRRCRVDTAAEGETALKLFQEAEATGNGYSLVLVDLLTGQGHNVVDVARDMLEMDPQANIIVTSGDAGNEVIINYEQYGFVGALTKPFSIDTVEDIARRFLPYSETRTP